MKSLNIVQMENGVLMQVATQPQTIVKSMVFQEPIEDAYNSASHIEDLLKNVAKELFPDREFTIFSNAKQTKAPALTTAEDPKPA